MRKDLQTIDQELRTKLAIRLASVTNRTKETRKFGLYINTILEVIRDPKKRATEATYEKLVRFANNDPLTKKVPTKGAQSKNTTDTISQPLVKFKSMGGITPDQRVTATDAALEDHSNGSDFTLLAEQVKALKTLFELNRDLTQQLMMRVDNATKSMRESEDIGLKNFERQSKAFNARLTDLEKQFDTLLKRHEYQNKQNKDIEDRLKKIEIKEWPTKIK